MERIAQGEDLQPHGSNPRSVEEDAREAMEKAAEETTETVEETEGVEETAEVSDASPETTEETEELGELEPPTSWTAEQQETFRNCPEHVQEFLLDLSEGLTAPYQQQISALAPWQQVEQQWSPYFQQHGMAPAQHVGQLLQADMILRTGTPQQKEAVLGSIMQAYGINFQEPAPDLSEYDDDPRMKAIMERQEQINRQYDQLAQQMQAGFGQVQTAQAQSGQQALQAFANQVDESGKLLHPYFSEVYPVMQSLAETAQRSGRQVTLEDVYEAACLAHPDVRAKVQSAERAAQMTKQTTAAAEKRRASKSVSGSPAGSRSVQIKDDPNATVEDTVRAAMAAASGEGGA